MRSWAQPARDAFLAAMVTIPSTSNRRGYPGAVNAYPATGWSHRCRRTRAGPDSDQWLRRDLEESYFQVGLAALQRGWRVMLICGPGQMDTARTESGTHFVPDTESWVSAWTDRVLDRSQVDRSGWPCSESVSEATSPHAPPPTTRESLRSWRIRR